MGKMAKNVALGTGLIFMMSLAVPHLSTAFTHKRIGGAIKKGTSKVGGAIKKGTSKVGGAVKKGASKVGGAVKKGAGAIKKAAEKAAKVAKKGYEGAKKAAGSAYKFAIKNCNRVPEPGKTACKRQVNLINPDFPYRPAIPPPSNLITVYNSIS